jgi:hypothetical protein
MKTFAFSTMRADLESSMQERNTPYETDVAMQQLERKKQ